jgi:hypothetical protein
VAATALKPTINMLSDPDYINQNICWWIGDGAVGFQTILDVIRYV